MLPQAETATKLRDGLQYWMKFDRKKTDISSKDGPAHYKTFSDATKKYYRDKVKEYNRLEGFDVL